MHWRYVILCAVSSDEQVKNSAGETKKSLDHQYNVARAWGDRHGGTFVRDYRAEGFSRTGWYDFSEALAACKEFTELARDARAHLFDVILMESFDRLGDLAVMWFTYLEKKVGAPYIQLRSAQKPLIIEDPEIYDPRYDESTPDALNDAQKTNRYRINKLRRGGEVGIPERARLGKYTRRLPRGYTFTGTRKEYRVDLDQAFKTKLIDAKDKYFQGWTLPALEAHTGWKRNAIKEMLRNPWYAGKTSVDRGVTKKNPGAKRGHWEPKDQPVQLYDGLHEACWDLDTYYALVNEIKRRGEHMRHKRAYPLTGLVICESCQKHMHISPARNKNYQYFTYYRCRSCGLSVREHVVMNEFVKALRLKMAEFQDAPLEKPEPVDNSRAIATLHKQLEKIRVAYETTDSYTAPEYAERKRAIMKDVIQLQDAEYQQQKQMQERLQQKNAVESVRQLLPDLEGWLSDTPPGEVNMQLAQAVKSVMVNSNKTVSVDLR